MMKGGAKMHFHNAMKILDRHLAFLAALVSLSVGCKTVAEVTDQERNRSFLSHEKVMVGSDSMRNHLLKRSAFLINGGELASVENSNVDDTDHTARANLTIRRFAPIDKLGLGTAAAVDRRGYFVTAAHCIQNTEVHLVFYTGNGFEAKKARVVYKGDGSSNESDFAVLYVPSPLRFVFDWAFDFEVGDSVVSTGVNDQSRVAGPVAQKGKLKLDVFSGHIEKNWQTESNGVAYHVVLHDSPFTYGNSGGPLVDESGRLVAINHTIVPSFWNFQNSRHRPTLASRPDPEWVAKIIEEDAINRTGQRHSSGEVRL